MTQPRLPTQCIGDPESAAGWLLAELRCPSDATVLGVYLIAGLILAYAAYRIHHDGVSESAARGVVANAWALFCCGAPTWAAVYALDVHGAWAFLLALVGAGVWFVTRDAVSEGIVRDLAIEF